jgi:O-succinylbenzoic acid--CoA ligase
MGPEATAPGRWLARAAAARPAAPALGVPGEPTLDFAQLLDRTARRATGLVAEGMAPGAPLAVLTRDGPSLAHALYAALHTGTPLLPLDPRREVQHLLRDCRIRQAIADPDTPLPAGTRRIPLAALMGEPAAAPLPPSPADPRAVQLYIATSGTGGRPRAVMLSGANLAAAAIASRARLPLAPGDTWLACLPLHHIGGLSIPLRGLEAAATVLLHAGFDARAVWEDLNAHPVTHLSLVPAMLARLLATAGGTPCPADLRHVLVGGGPLDAALAREALARGWPLRPTYGMSETASQVATLVDPGPDWRPGEVGEPLPGLALSILDAAGRPTRGPGHIHVGGPCVMLGYARADGRLGMGLDAQGLTTGDLGELDARGRLRVLGRADEVLVTGGENVHPQEVEGRLLACPGVDDAAIAARPDATWGQRLVALYVGEAQPDAVLDWCHRHLPGPLRPREAARVHALPRNALGKLERGRLDGLLEMSTGAGTPHRAEGNRRS